MINSTATPRRDVLTAAAMTLALVAVWALSYDYRGIIYDAQIYAVQALAHLRPPLRLDLFLANTSQDRFTVFSGAYAWVIQGLGLRAAAMWLTFLCTAWLLTAWWFLAAKLANGKCAWASLFLLIAAGGNYGAARVFYIAEPMMTARLPAEAMIVSALLCYWSRRPKAAFLIAAAAMLVHPLMALPGLALLACLCVPRRMVLMGAAAAIGCALAIALAAVGIPAVGHLVTVMDAPWTSVVIERSQFLFLKTWSAEDWALNGRPFLSLGLAVCVLADERCKSLAASACIVGFAGIVIAAIASLVGPVAILLQGQAWRWVWVAMLGGLVLVPPTSQRLWRRDSVGPLCAILLVAGWVLPVLGGAACVLAALALWMLRESIPPRIRSSGPRAATAAVIVIVGWALVESAPMFTAIHAAGFAGRPLIDAIRHLMGLKIWRVALAGLLWFAISKRSALRLVSLSIVLALISIYLLMQSVRNLRPYGSDADLEEFADWRARMPPAATVFVTDGHDSGSFVWFTLQRNNYLSPGQSAGVVFSRATALEVRRRSEVLLPVVDPQWKIWSAHVNAGSTRQGRKQFRSLTPRSLISLCADPQLDFVISPDEVGFDPLRHVRADAYQNWLLYDCNHVRGSRPTTT